MENHAPSPQHSWHPRQGGWEPGRGDRPSVDPPGMLARLGQGVAILVVLMAGVITVLLVLLVLSSRLGDPQRDPHGFGLIIGSVLLVPTSLLGAIALPFVARRDQPRSRRWALWAALVWVVAALAVAGFALLAG